MTIKHHLTPERSAQVRFAVTPASAGWRYLSFQVIALRAGETFTHETGANEVAVTALKGSAQILVDGQSFEMARRGVFEEPAQVLYVPPRRSITLRAGSDFEAALGGAPAQGKYPARLFTAADMRLELRGGGAAQRQVNHLLAHPLPAERLILYDAYVPGGMWAGYPPHCHDGYAGSPYLEETYYYCITPANGFAIHRNYCCDSDFDELFTVRDGDLVLVTQGFHPVAAAPGSNVYFLNYLAGDLYDDARATPPYDDPAYAWLKNNWQGDALSLPLFK
jgi:5-deoxy-glucuronate isomerase